MSGHNKWSSIKHKKGKADAQRGKAFTKITRELITAARIGGGDPAGNARLKAAIQAARAVNMPNDNIQRAIRRGTGEDKEAGQLEQIMYEGYAPHGVALMVNCVTDNRNRTVAELRHILTKYGGSLGENGSVAWQFTQIASFAFSVDGRDEDEVFELAVEAGADDVDFEEGDAEIVGPVESFKRIGDALKQAGIKIDDAGLRMQPNQEIELSQSDTTKVMRVIEELEELDDVQSVSSNLKISDEAIAELAG
jgi:YebC/PmpR family DNA-binding regulatory protein